MDPEANYREQQYIHRLIAEGAATAADKARLRLRQEARCARIALQAQGSVAQVLRSHV